MSMLGGNFAVESGEAESPSRHFESLFLGEMVLAISRQVSGGSSSMLATGADGRRLSWRPLSFQNLV